MKKFTIEKETKEVAVSFRLTLAEHYTLTHICKKMKTTPSKFIRVAIKELINKV